MADSFKLKNFIALDTKRERELIRECITKIMNTLPFRKLAGKTQVILSLTGPDVRTRLTHTIEVAKIAKDICLTLGLNEELAEAMALAHDIGHTPFGHVGERTLREIMCGCDTLGKKVQDCDFDNSGFKHNLQSFRVLIDLERINRDSNGIVENNDVWSYIIWGALAHTKMTYAEAYSGMDDEMFISSEHCDWVYVCHYDEKKECKRNIQKKKWKEVNKKEICKPWYCAELPVIENRNEVDRNSLNNNETRREYIKKEPIKETYLEQIYCSHKCYLAKLWKHKIKRKLTHKEYPYLFDHSFPNSFYAKSLYNYFNHSDSGTHKNFISFETQIVCQADEIAQRQQDLEDGINKNLISFVEAKKQVDKMVKEFKDDDGIGCIYDEIKNIKKSDDLGKLLANFYKQAIVNQTKKNATEFVSDLDKVQISIYSLMNILYLMNDDNEKKEQWILKELEALGKSSKSGDQDKIECLEDLFEINSSHAYLYLLSYDHLEKCTKQNEFSENSKNIMSKCIDSLNKNAKKMIKSGAKSLPELKPCLKSAHGFIRSLNLIRDYLNEYYKEESIDFFYKNGKKKWKTIGWLKLPSFYLLYQIYIDNFKGTNGQVITIDDLKDFNKPETYNPEDHEKVTFENWKEVLKDDANKVLGNLVTFTDKNNPADRGRRDALKDFKGKQYTTIIKSEQVEKNDGKASYILRRLFKAYITNSHQLPDLGLKYILISLMEEMKTTDLWTSEKDAFKEILDKLKKTIIASSQTNTDELKRIWETELLKFETDDTKFNKLKEGKSSEIIAALEKRKKLSIYFKQLVECNGDIIQKLNSAEEAEKHIIKNQLRELRAVLDNSILNKTRYWESILTRGICDYIASLTDQEAVNEYEKLYAGIMELV